MKISYKKLWKKLIDLEMKKQDLIRLANISASTVAKLGRNENVNIMILAKICSALDCTFDDIVEVEEDE
ncbi:helix-turn-helix domain-containing protein [Lachnospiraceae bacterium SGI.085]